MATYPKDRFDSVPDDLLRTGAHRGPRRKGHGWITFAWAALATVVLVAVGLFGLSVLSGRLNIDLPFRPIASDTATPSASSTPTATPKLDASLPITILNGTTTKGLATAVGDNLVKQGWNGASTDLGARADASTHDITKTLVYYSDPANEGAARALVLSLKVGDIRLSDVYTTSPLTVVLGTDYVLPAG
ncbi:MAG TPA: LytR C-terminal domain-containing protein [Lacisediminihabitans sp.]|uniref:LytR C-terminal domain-containing protein n=1 Tax=Lacisediminihabitans sp. TaxID=2787631 RepID=UPI002ED90EA0